MAEARVRRGLKIAPSTIVGLALISAGAILLVLAYEAQSSIDDIGAQTTDPVLKERVAALEDQRGLYLVSSLGALFIGFFALAILGEPSTPTSASATQMVSTARFAGGVVKGLSLGGNATIVPAAHGLTHEKMFVSASGMGELPLALSNELVMSPGNDGSTPGIVLDPLGLALLDEIQEELGITFKGAGVEAAEGGLQALKHGMGLMKDFHLKDRDGKTMMRVEYRALSQACSQARAENPDICRQVPCAGCSCILTAVARATGKAVSISEVDGTKATIIFTLVLRDW